MCGNHEKADEKDRQQFAGLDRHATTRTDEISNTLLNAPLQRFFKRRVRAPKQPGEKKGSPTGCLRIPSETSRSGDRFRFQLIRIGVLVRTGVLPLRIDIAIDKLN